ncbi:MAG: hypothetical protein B6D41_07125 [Chloroflexi bacterium UTCFX4]|nr:MAG: hypothetical protein B6D41_07125 [Chloroflexi bacterium UTCFX4]
MERAATRAQVCGESNVFASANWDARTSAGTFRAFVGANWICPQTDTKDKLHPQKRIGALYW